MHSFLTCLQGFLLEWRKVVERALLLLLAAEQTLHLRHDGAVGRHHEVVVGQGLNLVVFRVVSVFKVKVAISFP